MKFKIQAVALMVIGVITAEVLAADISGKWVAEVPSEREKPMTMTFNFKVDRTKLTGSVQYPLRKGELAISRVKVKRDKISFAILMPSEKIYFNGKVVSSEIKLTFETEYVIPGPIRVPAIGGRDSILPDPRQDRIVAVLDGKQLELTLKKAK